MKRLITTCAVVGLIMAVAGTAQAALDIDSIVMTSCKDHLDGAAGDTPWVFEVMVHFVNTGNLDHIDVSPPGGATPFAIYDGDWEYESPTDYSTLEALQLDYPTGTYTFDFRSTVGSLLTFGLDYNDLSEPDNPVDFTYPDDGAMDVPLDPTYTWTVGPSDGNALDMWVWDPVTHEDKYGNVAPMDTTSWQPGSLDPNHTYKLEVSVLEVKDGLLVNDEPALPTKEVGGDTFAYGLIIEHLNTIEFTTVPEPATIALLGLGGLLFRKRRDRKQSKK